MTKIEYFKIEESAVVPNRYRIVCDFDKLPGVRTDGSFNLLPARLMNLSYANYLRFCRDVIGGELYGKNTRYPIVVFSKTANLIGLVRLLNARMNLIMWEREHPDWREHQEYLAIKEQEKKARKEARNVSNS